jgi:hypothetical protein
VIRPARGVLSHLTETGHVIAGSITDDGGGGGTVTHTVGSALACRIDSLGGSEREVANRISDRSTHEVTLLADTTITVGNDFAIDGRGTFEVTAVREYTDELARSIEVVSRT